MHPAEVSIRFQTVSNDTILGSIAKITGSFIDRYLTPNHSYLGRISRIVWGYPDLRAAYILRPGGPLVVVCTAGEVDNVEAVKSVYRLARHF